MLRPTRPGLVAATLGAVLGLATPNPAQAQAATKPGQNEAQAAFPAFLESLWPDAKARGVARATFTTAFQGVTPDPKIVALTKKQSEFVQPIWGYLASAVGGTRLSRGQEVARQWSATLDAVEQRYGVPRSVVLGVWGMETNYGSFTGSMDVIRALATLAYTRYRGDFFRDELLTALQILQGGLDRSEMKGSWAGAMGHTQFMPSSYMKFAVDGDGDGSRDIWASIPDALASTANYLKQHGWQTGLPWGFEVELPEGFDFRNHRQGLGQWSGLGLRRRDGKSLPRSGEATLFLPGGAGGPAFLVTENYNAIKAYNSSDAYALAVAHLGDRIAGGQPVQGAWPTSEPVLAGAERVEVQKRLAALGLYAGESDGKLGSKTREAVRAFQLNRGLIADGYANPKLLKELRAAR